MHYIINYRDDFDALIKSVDIKSYKLTISAIKAETMREAYLNNACRIHIFCVNQKTNKLDKTYDFNFKQGIWKKADFTKM